MRSQNDVTGLIKFIGRDDWKSCFEGVMGEHFGRRCGSSNSNTRPSAPHSAAGT
jgi:hypothetical protein